MMLLLVIGLMMMGIRPVITSDFVNTPCRIDTSADSVPALRSLAGRMHPVSEQIINENEDTG